MINSGMGLHGDSRLGFEASRLFFPELIMMG